MGNILGQQPPRGAFRVGGNQVRPLPVPMTGGISGGISRPSSTISSPIISAPSSTSIISPVRATPTIQAPTSSRLTGISTPSTSVISRPTTTSVISRPGVSTVTPTTSTGTSLGSSNGLNIVRPGIVNPGTVGTVATVGTVGTVVGGAIARPVVPQIPVYSQQQQPSFWSTLMPTISAGPEGITAGVQGVLPNGMQVGGAVTRTPDGQIVGAVNGQSTTGYPQGTYPGQTYPGGTYPNTGGYRGPNGQTYTPSPLTNLGGNGTCLPSSNGIFGLFENTIGAGVRRIFGIRQLGCGLPANSGVPGAGLPTGVPRTPPTAVYNNGGTTSRSPSGIVGAPGGIVIGRPAPSVMYGN